MQHLHMCYATPSEVAPHDTEEALHSQCHTVLCGDMHTTCYGEPLHTCATLSHRVSHATLPKGLLHLSSTCALRENISLTLLLAMRGYTTHAMEEAIPLREALHSTVHHTSISLRGNTTHALRELSHTGNSLTSTVAYTSHWRMQLLHYTTSHSPREVTPHMLWESYPIQGEAPLTSTRAPLKKSYHNMLSEESYPIWVSSPHSTSYAHLLEVIQPTWVT